MSYVAVGAPPKKQPMITDKTRAYTQQVVDAYKNPEAYGPPGGTYPEATPESNTTLILGAVAAVAVIGGAIFFLSRRG